MGVNSTVTVLMDKKNESMNLSGHMVECNYSGYWSECYNCRYEAQSECLWS